MHIRYIIVTLCLSLTAIVSGNEITFQSHSTPTQTIEQQQTLNEYQLSLNKLRAAAQNLQNQVDLIVQELDTPPFFWASATYLLGTIFLVRSGYRLVRLLQQTE